MADLDILPTHVDLILVEEVVRVTIEIAKIRNVPSITMLGRIKIPKEHIVLFVEAITTIMVIITKVIARSLLIKLSLRIIHILNTILTIPKI